MRREEKELRVQMPDGKAFENVAVTVLATYQSQNYLCSNPVTNVIGSTGLLKVFELLPVQSGLPSFTARWDDKQETVDIDIEGVTPQEKQQFKEGKNGYGGHWTRRTPTTASIYTYDASISIPRETVFEGTVAFTVVRRQGITGKSRIVH